MLQYVFEDFLKNEDQKFSLCFFNGLISEINIPFAQPHQSSEAHL